MTFLSMIPPLAILPILFISFGVGELAKVMLIFFGIFPVICRDIYQATIRIPDEQVIKALTLGASGTTVIYRVVLPQILPRLLGTLRLSLGPAWLFLIAAEAIAATNGLGYRIFLVRRYLAMDVILPYVFWITFIGFTMDWLLRKFTAWRYPWYQKAEV
jgi:NitT/TauT family transport system permease protein